MIIRAVLHLSERMTSVQEHIFAYFKFLKRKIRKNLTPICEHTFAHPNNHYYAYILNFLRPKGQISPFSRLRLIILKNSYLVFLFLHSNNYRREIFSSLKCITDAFQDTVSSAYSFKFKKLWWKLGKIKSCT